MPDLVKFYQQTNNISMLETMINLGFCLIMAMAVRWVYVSFSASRSSKVALARVIPLLACVTFLVIVVVKSSLALSLGLVGALSIVRFRAPIKEPEELTYLFLAVAVGLGYGASQTLMTSLIVGIVLMYVSIFSRTRFYGEENDSIHCYCEWNGSTNFEDVIQALRLHTRNMDVLRLCTQDNISYATFALKLKKTTDNQMGFKDVLSSIKSLNPHLKIDLLSNPAVGSI